MLLIDDLHVVVTGNSTLNRLSLTANAGEVHAIMGLNGSGEPRIKRGDR